MIEKPKVAISSNTSVPTLIDYFKRDMLTLEELSDYMNGTVVWQSRPLSADIETWKAPNTWAAVRESIDANFTSDNYFFVITEYEKYMYAKYLREYEG